MNLQQQIEEHERKIQQLKAAQNRCRHTWGATKYDPIIRAGYETSAFSRPGYKSSATIYVPEERTPRWTRTCTTCGCTQSTKRTEERKTRGSVPGTSGTEQVPIF